MAIHIRWREFIVTLGSAAAAWPLAVRAQQPTKLPTIGFLGSASPATENQRVTALMQRLHQLGWIEGRTIAVELRWAEGRTERAAGDFAGRRQRLACAAAMSAFRAKQKHTDAVS